ncbi:MAG TPA: hypothetical protein VKA94_00595 [Hyphomicrobiales bacterium]|nr:hypothetical protein [Hyphomicrobiales bacterium]
MIRALISGRTPFSPAKAREAVLRDTLQRWAMSSSLTLRLRFSFLPVSLMPVPFCCLIASKLQKNFMLRK